MLVAVLGGGLMAWRILHGNEKMESGGSIGRQVFGRHEAALTGLAPEASATERHS